MQFTPRKSFDYSHLKSPSFSSGSKTCSPLPDESTGGRFIPNRVASNLRNAFEKAETERVEQPSEKVEVENFTSLLQKQLFGFDITNISQSTKNIFRYRPPSSPFDNKENNPSALSPLDNLYSTPTTSLTLRTVSRTPFKVLDAPQLQDDFYLNLVDWSANNAVAVGLGNAVYIYDVNSAAVSKLCELDNQTVTSISFSKTGTHAAVGTSSGSVLIYDVERTACIRSLQGHGARTGALAWNNWVLSSGSRDKSILHRDMRTPESYISRIVGHKQEICGLKWDFDGQHLASGGNDNKVILWNLQSSNPVAKFCEHKAAVKALAWSPHQHGLLVSGGGSADRTIRFWNALTCSEISHYETGSQICNLTWALNTNELVSTHGYSLNQITIWKYSSMQKVAVLTGHSSRVLHLASSPDGESIVTGAGDETLRFWNVFPKNQKDQESSELFWNVSQLR